MSEQLNDEEAIRARHRQRIEEMHRSKQRQMMYRRYFRKYAPLAAGVIIVFILIVGGKVIFHKSPVDKQVGMENNEIKENIGNLQNDFFSDDRKNYMSDSSIKEAGASADGLFTEIAKESGTPKTYVADTTADTLQIGDTLQSGDNFNSQYAILIDLDSGNILAEKYARTRINPASMTKVLTALVAAEHVENLDDTFTMTLEITDYGYTNDCSSAGFEKDEVLSIRDLFYGTVLPSGADAAVGLAAYVSGSQDAFVELMNEKLDELGLSQTAHFTNCVGIYDENHYCTVYDMAMIMEAAMDNELCREVMSAHTYTTSKTAQHPEGIDLSNWFLRRIEDKDSGGEVICGKTGYVVQSGSCAVSYAVDNNQKGYICVTAGAYGGQSNWRCIYDHARLYKQFIGS